MNIKDFLSDDLTVIDFEYIDTIALESYFEQVGTVGRAAKDNTKLKIEFSIPYLKVATETTAPLTTTTSSKLREVLKTFRKSGQILDDIPQQMSALRGEKFYFFSGAATKYRLPKEILTKSSSEDDVFLWLVERQFNDPIMETSGTVLYLLQKSDNRTGFYSGTSHFSAMQFLMSDAGVIELDDDPRRTRPQSDLRSPDAILDQIGAERQSRRKIISCYRCRSASDNMFISIGGRSKRFSDLVAYPLFIASL